MTSRRLLAMLACLTVLLAGPTAGAAEQTTFTQQDRELLVRIDERLNQIDKRFEQIDKRFEQVDKRFAELREDMNKRFEGVNKRFGDMNKRFEDINKRFEDVNKRFEEIITLMTAIVGAFAAIVAATIAFALWDRRTMIRPFESKVREIEEELAGNRKKLHDLIAALRKLSRHDDRLAEILRSFSLL